MKLAYRIVNVFAMAGDPFSGNPLCVFEDGSELDSARMQAIARQFNLSETTFLLPSTRASAGLRIFTPDYEMPFAGHPTLGSAAVAASLGLAPAGGGPIVLDMPAGLIPVTGRGDEWTLRAQPPRVRELDRPVQELAAALAIELRDVMLDAGGGRPRWVDTGVEQLLVPVRSPEAVESASPALDRLASFGNSIGKRQALVFHFGSAERVHARFFFESGSVLLEDPATGSACANLGGWCLQSGLAGPRRIVVSQGARVQRPSRLQLDLDAGGQIFVTGLVRELGRGAIQI